MSGLKQCARSIIYRTLALAAWTGAIVFLVLGLTSHGIDALWRFPILVIAGCVFVAKSTPADEPRAPSRVGPVVGATVAWVCAVILIGMEFDGWSNTWVPALMYVVVGWSLARMASTARAVTARRHA